MTRNYHNSTFKIKPRKAIERAPMGGCRSSMKRSKMKVRAVSKKATVDGASEREIRDECDELIRKILKLRDTRCVIFGCAETEGLQVGHYIKRGILALRWDLRNCNAQCPRHNKEHNADPGIYKSTMIFRYGIGITWQIEHIGAENPRVEYTELLAIRDGLRAAYEKAQKER